MGKASPSVPKKHRSRPGLSSVTKEEAIDDMLTIPVRRHEYSTWLMLATSPRLKRAVALVFWNPNPITSTEDGQQLSPHLLGFGV